jgi:plastocyanin
MAVMVAGLLTGTALGAAAVVVSQKGRAFEPNRVSIKRDQTLEIVNDDGDLLHHAYLKSDSFSFDSGDQEPGSKFDVTFPVAGEFTILCAIHPKMKLVVVVE